MFASFIFTRANDSSFEVQEELLKLVSLWDSTKGKDGINAVKSVVSMRVLTSAVVTVGTSSM